MNTKIKTLYFYKSIAFIIILLATQFTCIKSFAQQDITIKIIGNVGNKLILNKPTDTAWSGYKVIWEIDTSRAKNVKSFRIEMKKKPDFFSWKQPPKKHVKKDYGDVKNNLLYEGEYQYSFYWYDYIPNTKEHYFDPKISIKPTFESGFNFIFNILSFLLAPMLTFFGLRKLLKKDV